jgi:hypothetical protein
MPSEHGFQQERERLLAYGMTDEEVNVWQALGAVAGQMLKLPVLHQSEQTEMVHDIHHLQSRLLARPGLRAIGWPRGDS